MSAGSCCTAFAAYLFEEGEYDSFLGIVHKNLAAIFYDTELLLCQEHRSDYARRRGPDQEPPDPLHASIGTALVSSSGVRSWPAGS